MPDEQTGDDAPQAERDDADRNDHAAHDGGRRIEPTAHGGDGQGAPEGAVCAEHPEREAFFTCPRCGSYSCAFCWHPAVKRCHGCIKRDPTEASPPIPWEAEDSDDGTLTRYFRTLQGAIHPMRTAPAFARVGLRRAVTFLLLTALPLSLIAGIIPHTRTLLFTGHFQVQLLGTPSTAEIALDVLRAMGAQLTLTGVELASLYFPYTSLIRAYAPPERRDAAAKVLFYRLWLLPGTLALLYIGGWAGPPPDPDGIGLVTASLLLMRLIIPVFLMVAMGGVARLACGLGPFMSLLVVVVPMILLLVVEPLAMMGLEQLMPPIPEVTP